MSPTAVVPQPSDPPSKSKPPCHFAPIDEGIHAYRCPAEGDLRSVCPALNTLANHSYIPHDGKDISFTTLSHALQVGYGVTPMFADFLVVGSYILLRRSVLRPLDLHEIGLHDRIEHDASVVHIDDINGAKTAPTNVDSTLLHKFICKAYSPPSVRSSKDITAEDIARTRVAREADVAPLDNVHAEIARGEFAMVLNIFGKGDQKTLSAEDLEHWLNENRFPPHWAPTHPEGLLDTVAESKKIRELMVTYRGEEPHGILSAVEKSLAHQGEEIQNWFSGIGKTMGDLVQKSGVMIRGASVPGSELDEKLEAT